MDQRQSSPDVHPLGSHRFLTSILLASALLLPALSLDGLSCYHCPLQQKGKPCPNITSQCLPHQRCSNSRGHYGSVHMLSSQGCLDSHLCGSHEIISYRGVEFNVSHSCCCKNKCNEHLKSAFSLKTLLRKMAGRLGPNDINKGLDAEPLNMLLPLRVALLCFYFIPSLLCANLRCYYSPVLEKEEKFELVETECPPDELCYKADGRYGNHSALTGRGCMAKKDCSQVHKIRLKGTIYTMSYSCCDGPYCNSSPRVEATSLYITAALMTVAVMAGSM
ncbi:hypothetical protein NQZ68_038073 [Xyrichtys novacula]|uniref:Protein Bouncer n=1 Tax=Xyrichtys novacula TaxID=13765 RepID=A0AAV1F6M9_XYRNO|nr:hypothetical protein NQZ68_038073 [Xyrichtys novacula]